MATTEHTINDALAAELRKTRRLWQIDGVVNSENTGSLRGSNRRPDILVVEPNVSPVVVETELLPASTVELEAKSRLGECLRSTGRDILSSIAVRLPDRLKLRSGRHLASEVAEAEDIEMALFTGISAGDCERWPRHGWMQGNVASLSLLIQSASVPPSVVEAAANQLVEGVSETAGLLEEMAKTNPGAISQISAALHQQDGPQTRRMAMAIAINAFVFHQYLAGGPGRLADIKSLDQLRGVGSGISKADILDEWVKVLCINYWPVFDIARRILEFIPTVGSGPLIARLKMTADRLLENRMMRSHDLTGAVFQRLIVDRKFLAAYYTTPASAALLVGLTFDPAKTPSGGDWSKAEDVKALRIADLSCGTGTLMSTAYQRLGQLHELAGGDSEAIHPDMMANSLIGCDILPAATHLTASMLAGAHPTINYDRSSILTVAYGVQDNGRVALGSLNLLDVQGRLVYHSITAKTAEGIGQSERDAAMYLPHASFDVVIMNPPFTRATGQEAAKIGIPVPMFSGLGIGPDDQKAMSKALKILSKDTSAHGNAGEASYFLVLGHRKTKNKGMMSLVMPLSLVAGDSWEKSRVLLSKFYIDLVVVTISGADGRSVSFSADTGMAECLVVGRKHFVQMSRRKKTTEAQRRTRFVVLNERPANTMVGAEIARRIRRSMDTGSIPKLEDGPVGGKPIHIGHDVVGHILDASLPDSGGWYLSRVADLSVAQAAHQIAENGRIWLPSMPGRSAVEIPIVQAGLIGAIGPYHSDIQGNNADGTFRGPFVTSTTRKGSVPAYPVLWSHDAPRERRMSFEADREGQPVQGRNPIEAVHLAKKLETVWATASHCHINRDFRFNSQSMAMQFTKRPTLGGRAWPSLSLSSVEQEKALVAWGNTTFGLLMYWWVANKQQPGRGMLGVKTVPRLPVLDVKSLARDRMLTAAAIFDKMCNREFLPINECDKDQARSDLDEMFGHDVLGLPDSILSPDGPVGLLRSKLAKEPSVHGGKVGKTGDFAIDDADDYLDEDESDEDE